MMPRPCDSHDATSGGHGRTTGGGQVDGAGSWAWTTFPELDARAATGAASRRQHVARFCHAAAQT